MAITADFYTFAKRKNSTKIPSSQPTTYNITLKDDCSITNPVIGLDIGIANNPHNYNYCKITSFGRWYYVSDWVWSGRLWWATLSVDVLATHKSEIINSHEYVTRSSCGNYIDGAIIDTMYPAKNTLKTNLCFADGSLLPIWTTNYNNGCYVVGIINNDKYSIGAVSYYLLLPAGFKELKDLLLSDTNWTGINTTNPDLGDNLYRSLFNPYQYFTTINWFPFVPSLGQLESLTSLNIGWWPVTFTASNVVFRITASSSADRFVYQHKNGVNNHTVTLYNHPQAFDRGEFLNANPYTKYVFCCPPWGIFELDGNLLAGAAWTATGSDNWPQYTITLTLDMIVDLISGLGTLIITAPTRTPTGLGIATIYTATAEVAVPIQLAQIAMSDVTAAATRQAVNTAVPYLQDILTGLGINYDISNLSALGNGLASGAPIAQTSGGNGTISAYFLNTFVLQIFSIMVDDALNDKGRPVCQYLRLGDCTGFYVQTSGAHVDISGYEDEINEINTALDGGVYLE